MSSILTSSTTRAMTAMPPSDAQDPTDRAAPRAPATSAAGASALAARRERESAALRANLLRRKQQARVRQERSADAASPAEGDGASEPPDTDPIAAKSEPAGS